MSNSAQVWLPLVGGFTAGMGLGLIYFFGLWMTTRGIAQSRNAGLLMISSLALRLGIVLTGFYYLMTWTGWQGMVTALFGFALVRLILTRLLGPVSKENSKQT
ncbi:MAG: ATP synthase subunit I [Thermodesulfobacteriota bacterium]|nr:ATP synthase subunit I [Thermodesulfobacteriota bacterium]